MKTTLYDRVASFLVALLILLGGGVGILFALWLTAQAMARPTAVPVEMLDIGEGAGTDAADEYDPDVLRPGLEFEEEEPTLLESLETVVNIVAKNESVFSESAPSEDMLLVPGGRRGDGRTKGEGTGLAGPPRRWQVHFGSGMTVKEYAAMLDSFGIELGVLKPGGKIDCVSRLSAPKPRVRELNSGEEKRYYLTQIKGETEAADREILDVAGVDHTGRLILKLLPPELEAELQRLEAAFAKGRDRPVKASFFRVIQEGQKYRFEIYNQVF